MGQRSTIEQDPAVRGAVDAAIARGATIDAIVEQLRGLGSDVSRSAVGRYTKNYAELARQQRDLQAVASTFAADFGGPDNHQGRLLVQLMTSIATRMAMKLSAAAGDGDDGLELSTKELMEFGRAVKDVTSAAEIDSRRAAKIREEAARQAKAEAAEAAEQVQRAAGASEDTIRQVRARILGLKS